MVILPILIKAPGLIDDLYTGSLLRQSIL